jgi:hypothetical protein
LLNSSPNALILSPIDFCRCFTVLRLVPIFILLVDGFVSRFRRSSADDPVGKGNQLGMPQILVGAVFNIPCSATSSLIGKIPSWWCTDGMLIVMSLCVSLFICFSWKNCNQNHPAQCRMQMNINIKIQSPTTYPPFEAGTLA